MEHADQVVKWRRVSMRGNYCVLVIPNLRHLCIEHTVQVIMRRRVSKWGNYCVLCYS